MPGLTRGAGDGFLLESVRTCIAFGKIFPQMQTVFPQIWTLFAPTYNSI